MKKPRAIKRIGKKVLAWKAQRLAWIEAHPPDDWGYWDCYLKIHPWCPGRVDIDQLTLDHEQAGIKKSQSPLHPACVYCNGLKGSRSLESVLRDAQDY